MSVFLFVFILIGIYFGFGRYLGMYAFLVDPKSINKCKTDYSLRPTVSMMITCFKEGKDVWDCVESIMASNYPKELIQIVACDDCSPDDSWEYLLKLKEKYPDNMIILRNEVNLGKPDTLHKIAEVTTGEIIFNVDGDTIIDADAIRHMVACYADPEMGAVGAEIRIKNVNDSLWTQLQTLQYAYQTWLFKPLENLHYTSRCLCGPLVSFRRTAYMPMQPLIKSRNFFGERAFHGEDTFITNVLVLGVGFEKPWKVFNSMDAIAWTGTPATTVTYLNQQLRWRKGTVVNSLYVMKNLFRHTMKAGVPTALITTMLTLLLVSVLMTLLYFWIIGIFLAALATMMVAISAEGVTRCYIYNMTIAKRDKMGPIKNPFLTGCLFSGWYILSWVVLTFFGTFTLDDGGWLTRQKQGNVR